MQYVYYLITPSPSGARVTLARRRLSALDHAATQPGNYCDRGGIPLYCIIAIVDPGHGLEAESTHPVVVSQARGDLVGV